MESVLGMDSSHKDGNHNIVIYLFIERGRIEANIEELDFVDGKERVIRSIHRKTCRKWKTKKL